MVTILFNSLPITNNLTNISLIMYTSPTSHTINHSRLTQLKLIQFIQLPKHPQVNVICMIYWIETIPNNETRLCRIVKITVISLLTVPTPAPVLETTPAPVTTTTPAPAAETPKYLGTFKNPSHGVKGDIFMLDQSTLYIQGFSFDGEAPDPYFWSDGVPIPYYTR